jgi:hypothetical protein
LSVIPGKPIIPKLHSIARKSGIAANERLAMVRMIITTTVPSGPVTGGNNGKRLLLRKRE